MRRCNDEESARGSPGEFLAELDEFPGRACAGNRVSRMQVSHIVHGNRSVDADLALRLGKAFRPDA